MDDAERVDKVIDRQVGLRLKLARKAMGFKTALEFSRKIGMPKSTYSQHEKGSRSLTAELLIKYSEQLEIAPGWLLTGIGHPCPNSRNKEGRKKFIDEEVVRLQERKELPVLKTYQIDYLDTSCIVNMELFGKIITTAISMLTSTSQPMQSEALVEFCIDVYNNIAVLEAKKEDKEKIIELSLASMFKGYNTLSMKMAKKV